MTLVPALAKTAAHVTMLQRSPTYIVARPSEDAAADWIRRLLPERLALRLIRWKNVLLGMYFYNLALRKPEQVKQEILRLVREQLGPDYDVEKHFAPRYNPWDQRLCLVPDADLFVAIRSGKASVVTDEIETFTEGGIRLKSGDLLQADIIVTATGLKLKCLGGMQVSIDGTPINMAGRLSYKGMMFRGIPNFSFTLGYTNASWTLKCNLVAEYICRLLNHMSAHGYDCAIPVGREPAIVDKPALNLNSGYIRRGIDLLPKQGSERPWTFHQNYARTCSTSGSVPSTTAQWNSLVSRTVGGRFLTRLKLFAELPCRENASARDAHEFLSSLARAVMTRFNEIIRRPCRLPLERGIDAMSRTLNLELSGNLYQAFAEVAARDGLSPEAVGTSWLIDALAPREDRTTPTQDKMGIVWEGPQLGLHSFAQVNREFCLRLIDRGHELALISPESRREARPFPASLLKERFHRSLAGRSRPTCIISGRPRSPRRRRPLGDHAALGVRQPASVVGRPDDRPG